MSLNQLDVLRRSLDPHCRASCAICLMLQVAWYSSSDEPLDGEGLTYFIIGAIGCSAGTEEAVDEVMAMIRQIIASIFVSDLPGLTADDL